MSPATTGAALWSHGAGNSPDHSGRPVVASNATKHGLGVGLARGDEHTAAGDRREAYWRRRGRGPRPPRPWSPTARASRCRCPGPSWRRRARRRPRAGRPPSHRTSATTAESRRRRRHRRSRRRGSWRRRRRDLAAGVSTRCSASANGTAPTRRPVARSRSDDVGTGADDHAVRGEHGRAHVRGREARCATSRPRWRGRAGAPRRTRRWRRRRPRP